MKEAIMATGLSLFFLAVGAILTFAVDTSVSGIDLDTIGVILMVIGLLGMLFSLVLWDNWAPRAIHRDDYVDHDVVIDEAPVRRSVTRRVYR
jgi:sterol desaturase/sphingolipid hydroxylase (fatty acid hydroxylase superfamily)